MDIIGVPFNSAGRPDGVVTAPQALRDAGLIARLQRPDPSPSDPAHPVLTRHGMSATPATLTLACPGRNGIPRCGLRALDSLQFMTASVHQAVAESIHGGDRALVIGGDCPVLLGCLLGAGDVVGGWV